MLNLANLLSILTLKYYSQHTGPAHPMPLSAPTEKKCQVDFFSTYVQTLSCFGSPPESNWFLEFDLTSPRI